MIAKALVCVLGVLGVALASGCGVFWIDATGGTAECEEFNTLYEDCTGMADWVFCDVFDELVEDGIDCFNVFKKAVDTFECDTATGTPTMTWGICEG